MKTRYLPFYILALAVFIGIAGPGLLSYEMFVDGLVYSSISRNLADNLGSFFNLHYTETLYPHFFGHPPLAFGLQSLFFRILGDGLYTERIYSILTFFITGWIITLIWRELRPEEDHKFSWLPLILWVTIPLVTWAPSSNLLENTMMIFTSLSVLFLLKSLRTNWLLYTTFSGLMIFLGFLTKGPVALFPLTLPFWILLSRKNFGFMDFFYRTIVLVSALILPFLVLFIISPDSLEYMKNYYNNQIIGSIHITTVQSHFYILFRLLLELLPAVVISLTLFALTYKKKVERNNSNWIIVFIALGLSGTLPFMISLKQSGFYLLATLPFFSIAAAFLILPRLTVLMRKINFEGKGYGAFKLGSIVLILTAMTINATQINKLGNKKDRLQDIQILITDLPHNSIISIPGSLKTDWSLHSYLQRFGRISLDANQNHAHHYLLTKKGSPERDINSWNLISSDLRRYDLYERIASDQAEWD